MNKNSKIKQYFIDIIEKIVLYKRKIEPICHVYALMQTHICLYPDLYRLVNKQQQQYKRCIRCTLPHCL